MPQHSSVISINYLWIGPPPSEPRTINGESTYHDTEAAILMAGKISVQTHCVTFFCLDEYAAHYRTALHNDPIEVVPIREFLTKQHPKFRKAATQAIEIMDELLQSGRNTIRDRVTVKNILSLFILMTKGDFVLDSNVRPLTTVGLNLTRKESFCAPMLIGKDVVYNAHEVWMLFSPPDDNSSAIIAFDFFYRGWKEVERTVYAEAGDGQEYCSKIAQLIVQSISQIKSLHSWAAPFTEGTRLAKVPELGVVKYYLGTHKFAYRTLYETNEVLLRDAFVPFLENLGIFKFPTKPKTLIYEYVADEKSENDIRKLLDVPLPGTGTRGADEAYKNYGQMFMVVHNGDIDQLNKMLSQGADVNQPLITGNECLETTALCVAIMGRQISTMERLLQKGAYVDLVTQEKTRDGMESSTVNDLIMEIPENERKPFMDLYEKYKDQVSPKLGNQPF